MRFKGTYREAGWRRAASLSTDVGSRFKMWERDDFPTCSLPALEAAKCAARQGAGALEVMHLALFEAFFSGGRNIGNPDEVIEVARGAGLDMPRFLEDYRGGAAREEVLREYEEAVTRHGVRAIPTVLIDGERLVGAVPEEEYLALLRRLGLE